jgi:hypothetical protein
VGKAAVTRAARTVMPMRKAGEKLSRIRRSEGNNRTSAKRPPMQLRRSGEKLSRRGHGAVNMVEVRVLI